MSSEQSSSRVAVPLTYPDKAEFEKAQELEKMADYESAADEYSELLENRAKEHGEMSKCCAEPALRFAKCLLRAAQARNDEMLTMRVTQASTTNSSNPVSIDNSKKQGLGSEETSNETPAQEDEPTEESVEEMFSTATANCDLAIRIFSELLLSNVTSEAEMQLYSKKLADAHTVMGEIASELDNFDIALKEYQKAAEFVSFDAQLLSSIYCSTAATYICKNDLTQAVHYFQKAHDALSAHHKVQDDALKSYSEILTDIKTRIDELNEEIQDVQRTSVPVSKLIQQQLAPTQSSNTFATPTPNVPVHILVPRKKDNKRKLEEQDHTSTEGEEPPAKKQRTDDRQQ